MNPTYEIKIIKALSAEELTDKLNNLNDEVEKEFMESGVDCIAENTIANMWFKPIGSFYFEDGYYHLMVVRIENDSYVRL